MKQKRFSEEQIIAILTGGTVHVPVADLCGKHGVSESTYTSENTNTRI